MPLLIEKVNGKMLSSVRFSLAFLKENIYWEKKKTLFSFQRKTTKALSSSKNNHRHNECHPGLRAVVPSVACSGAYNAEMLPAKGWCDLLKSRML